VFKNLLTAPADRKREGLVKILEAFENSKFILIGDSGEQDLELYAQCVFFPNYIIPGRELIVVLQVSKQVSGKNSRHFYQRC
jgi:phosphatidate phosphatase APP1